MHSKPSWPLFLIWLIAYTILDILIEATLHGHIAWGQLPGAIEGAILGATLTWLFAYRRWLKSDSGF
jgi:hypothetical protein